MKPLKQKKVAASRARCGGNERRRVGMRSPRTKRLPISQYDIGREKLSAGKGARRSTNKSAVRRRRSKRDREAKMLVEKALSASVSDTLDLRAFQIMLTLLGTRVLRVFKEKSSRVKGH